MSLISYTNLSESADTVAEELRGDEDRVFPLVT